MAPESFAVKQDSLSTASLVCCCGTAVLASEGVSGGGAADGSASEKGPTWVVEKCSRCSERTSTDGAWLAAPVWLAEASNICPLYVDWGASIKTAREAGEARKKLFHKGLRRYVEVIKASGA
jgi:hypothetical protein